MLKITPSKPDYPKQLKQLSSTPKMLYIKSDNWSELLNMPMLAVVGSRKPTPYGVNVCQQLVRQVASRGVCIVSGLALGIDSIAHKTALEVNAKTIAVLPSGVNNIYPASHRNIASQIIKRGGALISEYQPDEKIAYKGNFVARNRIIAGISQAVLIPEAAEKSGSLHTAQFALDGGIDVLAVPGQITNPSAAGCNNLIKSGATMVTSVSDVLDVLKISSNPHAKRAITAANAEEYIILSLINKGINDGEDLCDKSKLEISTFSQTITMLEINGRIKPGGANTWYLT